MVDAARGSARISSPAGPRGINGTPGPSSAPCLNIGCNAIVATIASGRATTVAGLGAELAAGTSCGSCRPELGAFIARNRLALAPEEGW